MSVIHKVNPSPKLSKDIVKELINKQLIKPLIKPRDSNKNMSSFFTSFFQYKHKEKDHRTRIHLLSLSIVEQWKESLVHLSHSRLLVHQIKLQGMRLISYYDCIST